MVNLIAEFALAHDLALRLDIVMDPGPGVDILNAGNELISITAR